MFCSSTIRSVGYPLHSYTTNNNESINRVSKDNVCYKKQEWPEFNNMMFQLVKDHLEKQSVVVGNMRLLMTINLKVPHTEWIRMTPEQRKAKVEKVMKHVLKELPASSGLQMESSSNTKQSIDWNDAHNGLLIFGKRQSG